MGPEILFLQNFQVSQNIIFFEFPPNHACKTVKKKKIIPSSQAIQKQVTT